MLEQTPQIEDVNEARLEDPNNPQNWANPPSLAALKQNLNDSRSFRDMNVGIIQNRLNHLKIEGTAKPKKREGHSSVQPKLIRRHAEWRYSALSEAVLSTTNFISCKPRTHADRLAAQQNQAILNYQWNNQIDKQRFVDTLVRKAVNEGVMFVRVGWETQYETQTKDQPIFEFYPATEQWQIQELQQASMLQQKDPYAFKQHITEHIQQALILTEQTGQAIYPTQVDIVQTQERVLKKNQPTMEVCNVKNCYPDPSCRGDLSKAKFFIYSFLTSKADLKAQGRYFNVDEIRTHSKTMIEMSDLDFAHGFQFQDEPRKQMAAFEYWGYWDVEGNGTLTPIVATWVGDTLVRLEENPFPDKQIPFVSEAYMPEAESLYGETDGELLIENQQIIGAVTRGAIDLLSRSANGQEGMRQDALDPVNKRKYLKGENYEFRQDIPDPRMAMIQHTYPEIPNSVSWILQTQNQDAEALTGLVAFSGGMSSANISETAAGTRGVLDAATKRETAILRRIVSLFRKIVKKQIAMNGKFLSDEEIIRVTDEDFITIRREDLEGNLDIEIDIATAEEDAAKAQELSFMLQTMGNTMPVEMSQIVLADICRLRRMPHLAKRIEDYRPEPDPIQQQIQQLELQKLQLECAKLQSEVQENHADVQLTMAKANSEYAKAGNIQSNTDQANLDFLDQQSGLTHQREMQKDKAQSEGNMALEILKAQLQTQYPKPATSKS